MIPFTPFISEAPQFCDIGAAVELPRSARVGHITYLAVDSSFGPPGTIVLADDRPGDSRITVRISPIQLLAVVEPHCNVVGDFGRRTPFENFLSPVHAQVSMHPTG